MYVCMYRSEKEHIKKINTIDQEREKLEEFSKKEHERLLARKNDLSTQLLSMEVKFKVETFIIIYLIHLFYYSYSPFHI